MELVLGGEMKDSNAVDRRLNEFQEVCERLESYSSNKGALTRARNRLLSAMNESGELIISKEREHALFGIFDKSTLPIVWLNVSLILSRYGGMFSDARLLDRLSSVIDKIGAENPVVDSIRAAAVNIGIGLRQRERERNHAFPTRQEVGKAVFGHKKAPLRG